MKVYHGSITVIEHAIANAGRDRLDFGKGFYVTDIQSQAESWADRMSRINEASGIVSVYELDIEKAKNNHYSYKHFEHYDNEWLQYIVANRTGNTAIEKYDIIEGGVANDRVIDTVEAYIANMMPLETALRELARHQPNNQICICNQRVIDDYMTFVESYKI
ncbi:MAG: DUF3990 domain-containing protein [Prevotella sp.]|nr:DUF3990 domain-containing protein [Prevotella sp.]